MGSRGRREVDSSLPTERAFFIRAGLPVVCVAVSSVISHDVMSSNL